MNITSEQAGRRARQKYKKTEKGKATELRYWRSEAGRITRSGINRRWRTKTRKQAMLVIALRWGDQVPRCRADTLPIEHALRALPCYGRLEIDHINGGGNREWKKYKGDPFYRAIVNGERKPDDLRILCILHQLWNRPEA